MAIWQTPIRLEKVGQVVAATPPEVMPLNVTSDAIRSPSFKGPRQKAKSRDLETVKQSVLDFLKVALARVGEVPALNLWCRFLRSLPDIRIR